jgi:stage V sporulation protein D (sporulation-specific penicillin-binding protein)
MKRMGTYPNLPILGYSATALQMAAGFSSILNGGTYYQPYLVDTAASSTGKTTVTKPRAVERNVVTKQVSDEVISLLEQNNTNHIKEGFSYLNFGSNYSVGGKTGTAEIADSNGGYSATKVNGTYMGFVGGDTPEYAIVVYVLQPTKYVGFAGAGTGQPVFADIAHMLINDYGVTPRTP